MAEEHHSARWCAAVCCAGAARVWENSRIQERVQGSEEVETDAGTIVGQVTDEGHAMGEAQVKEEANPRRTEAVGSLASSAAS